MEAPDHRPARARRPARQHRRRARGARRAVRGVPRRPGRGPAGLAGRDRRPHQPGRRHARRRRPHDYPFLADEIKLMRRMVHEGAPGVGHLPRRAAPGHRGRRRRLPAQAPRGGLDDHREGRRRPAAARHLARRSSPSTGTSTPASSRRRRTSSPSAATACRCSAPAAGPGARSSTPRSTPRWRRTGCATPSRSRSTWAQAFAEQAAARETDERLPAYPAFCRRITENFVVNAGLLPD